MANLVQYEYQNNLISFEIDEEIMVNATQMAKLFRKKVNDFLRLSQTQEYILILTKRMIIDTGIPVSSENEHQNFTDRYVLKVIKGGRKNQGTWMHQELALKFAAWLSPEFEVWVFQQIKTLLKTGSVSLPNHTVTQNDLLDLRNFMIQQNQELKEDLKSYIDQKHDKFALAFAKDLEALSQYLLSTQDWQTGLASMQAIISQQEVDNHLLREILKLLLIPQKHWYVAVKPHYVYLFKEVRLRLYKIGYSGEILTRQQAVAIWGEVDIVHQISAPSRSLASLVEQLLHKIYQSKHQGRECYDLNDKDVAFICSL